ncbi:MAG TPA: hypothetical protein VFQ88_15430 [Nevskiaceae bacterium]|nr:hypothetical protein [Nevskiaceae bacterium]
MPPGFWFWITPFGNSAILLPVAGVIAALLLARRETRRIGWWWCATLAVECAAVGGTKVAYMAWGWAPRGLDFIGLSGDSAMAFVFWPAASAYASSRAGLRWRCAALAVGVVLAVLVTVSRVETYAHSVAEAVSGAVFGALIVTGFLMLSWRTRLTLASRWAWLPVAVLVALLLVTAGRPRPIDYNDLFARAALLASGHRTIYTRCDLGPWAALRPGDRNCHPRGPATVG